MSTEKGQQEQNNDENEETKIKGNGEVLWRLKSRNRDRRVSEAMVEHRLFTSSVPRDHVEFLGVQNENTFVRLHNPLPARCPCAPSASSQASDRQPCLLPRLAKRRTAAPFQNSSRPHAECSTRTTHTHRTWTSQSQSWSASSSCAPFGVDIHLASASFV